MRTKTPAELIDAYAEWAPSYDADSMDAFGYRAPDTAADFVAACLPDRESRILDVGAGTGLVGERLLKHGFSRVSGVASSSHTSSITSFIVGFALSISSRRSLYEMTAQTMIDRRRQPRQQEASATAA